MSPCIWPGQTMTFFKIAGMALLLVSLTAKAACSQPTVAERSEIPSGPKTKLEAIVGTNGAVLVRQSTEVGSIGRGSIRVAAIMVTNAASGVETKGLLISPAEGAGDKENAYIDYDEIPGLLSGIDQIASVDPATLKLANFEAVYHTRGKFSVGAYGSGDSKSAFITTGGRSGDPLAFDFTELARLRDLVRTAKRILDNPDLFEAKDNRQPPPAIVAQPQAARPPEVADPVVAPQLRPKARAKPKARSKAKASAKSAGRAKTRAKSSTKSSSKPPPRTSPKSKPKASSAKGQPFPKPI